MTYPAGILNPNKITQIPANCRHQDIDNLCLDETSFALGEQGQRGMSVLRDAAGEQHRERYCARGKQGDKQQVRSRLRDDAHQHGQQDHPWDVVADEGLDVKVMQPDLDDEQGTEGPEEDAEEVLPDDVLPEVFLDDMFGRRGDEPHHKQAHHGEDEVHPIFVEDVEMMV